MFYFHADFFLTLRIIPYNREVNKEEYLLGFDAEVHSDPPYQRDDLQPNAWMEKRF